MTDNETFYHPRTGEPLYRVPVGATIPANTPYGTYVKGMFFWGEGIDPRRVTADSGPHFTAEPITRQVPLEFGFAFRIIGGPYDGERAVVADLGDQACPIITENLEWIGVNWVPDWEPINNKEVSSA